ncbi:MAG: TetR/AcrR family transcriptional regulator [Gemmatimonadaceae bacterium]|nr:TetR/AcrR family transcriptional regulator [Chitinophagaceae bacterium]
MEIKDRIRVKAEELFWRYGIRSVSMDDIATQLGMSKKTIYQYFADKDELVDAVINREINEMQHDCLDCSSKARDAVHEMFLTMEQIYEKISNMNPMVLNDLEKFHFESFQKFMQYKNRFLLQVITNNLTRGIEEGLYREELNVDVIARFRLESALMAFNMTIFPPNKYNLANVSLEVMEHYLYGLASQKGHKLIQKYKQDQTKKPQNNAKSK